MGFPFRRGKIFRFQIWVSSEKNNHKILSIKIFIKKRSPPRRQTTKTPKTLPHRISPPHLSPALLASSSLLVDAQNFRVLGIATFGKNLRIQMESLEQKSLRIKIEGQCRLPPPAFGKVVTDLSKEIKVCCWSTRKGTPSTFNVWSIFVVKMVWKLRSVAARRTLMLSLLASPKSKKHNPWGGYLQKKWKDNHGSFYNYYFRNLVNVWRVLFPEHPLLKEWAQLWLCAPCSGVWWFKTTLNLDC